MSEDHRLLVLIVSLVREVMPAIVQAHDEQRRSPASDLLTGSDVVHVFDELANLEPLAAEILKELGPKSALRDADDIQAVVSDELARSLSVDSSLEVAFKAAASRLRNPTRRFRFRVPISAASIVGVNMSLGVDDLCIQDRSEETERPRMELVGCIEAAYTRRVVERVERHIKSIAGTFIGCGMARYFYARIPSVPTVTIDDPPGKLHLDAAVGALAAGLVFGVPRDLDEMQRERVEKTGLAASFGPALRRMTYVIASTDVRATALRSAAMLYADAVAATDPGKCVAFALMTLEAILLERTTSDTILARLKEAVAYRLGGHPSTARGYESKSNASTSSDPPLCTPVKLK